jgi:hypothetical protein
MVHRAANTMGPRLAATLFNALYPQAARFEANLYGSLAATGKGHLTDTAIREVYAGQNKAVELLWFPDQFKTVPSQRPHSACLRRRWRIARRANLL